MCWRALSSSGATAGDERGAYMVIDARGLKAPEPLQRLREIAPTMCSLDGQIELLIDDEAAFKQVRTYAAVSGCRHETSREEGYYRIRIEAACG